MVLTDAGAGYLYLTTFDLQFGNVSQEQRTQKI